MSGHGSCKNCKSPDCRYNQGKPSFDDCKDEDYSHGSKCERKCDCKHKSSKKGTCIAQLSSNIKQDATTTPAKVKLNLEDILKNVGLENQTDVRIKKDGYYAIFAAPQVGGLFRGVKAYADFWLRKNGVDIGNSNVRIQFTSPDQKDVIITQGISLFKKGDIVTVMMSGEADTGDVFIEPIQPSGEPLVPSIIFTMYSV